MPSAPATIHKLHRCTIFATNWDCWFDEAFDEWEFPKRKCLQGWNVGTPGLQGSYDYFKEWGERDIADMVKRDRNHLSIFSWSIGNEVDYPNGPYSHPVLDGNCEVGLPRPCVGGIKKMLPMQSV